MPRHRTQSRQDLVPSAMQQFWVHGFVASSMDRLVQATGVSRHGIYQDADGKEGLFIKALEAYRDDVVTGAFAQVKAQGASLTDVRAYVEQQIATAEQPGLPGPGCLMANTMTEPGAVSPDVKTLRDAHLVRLIGAITRVVQRAYPELGNDDAQARAEAFVTALQGLRAVSRQTTSAARLRRIADRLMTLIEG